MPHPDFIAQHELAAAAARQSAESAMWFLDGLDACGAVIGELCGPWGRWIIRA